MCQYRFLHYLTASAQVLREYPIEKHFASVNRFWPYTRNTAALARNPVPHKAGYKKINMHC